MIAVLGRKHEGLNEVYLWRMNEALKMISNNTAQVAKLEYANKRSDTMEKQRRCFY